MLRHHTRKIVWKLPVSPGIAFVICQRNKIFDGLLRIVIGSRVGCGLLPTTANNNSGTTTMMANVKHILPIVIISCWRLLLLASCVAAAVTADIQQQQQTITVHGRLQFPDKTPYNTTTKISVNHGESITYSRTDGNFTLYDLTPGIYLIDVLSVNHHFSQVKCQYKPDDADVLENKKPALSCLEYVYPGAPKRVLDQILVIHALAEIQYFEERKSGWLMVTSMVKNPMLLMMIVMVGMMYMMPKLMEDMNPEERAQMKKQMALQQDPVKMLGEMFTGGGGGSSSETATGTTAAIEGGSGSKKKSGKKNK
jgi:ER membrane protein complex subunit 7